MSELAVKAVPRRGRFWVVSLFAIVLVGLGYLVVEIAVQEPNDDVIELEGVGDAQRLFGGVPQEGDRVGSSNAPVTIQVFSDVQCAACREDFLATIPTLVEDYARPGDVQLLWRHYSNSENVRQLGFYGAEAAAEQGYAWQYIYLFFRNQDQVSEFGVDQEFLATIANGIAELDGREWEDTLEADGTEGAIAERLAEDEKLGRDLRIRTGQAAIVTGPAGTRTLQDGAGLGALERAIAAVA